jgi:hypothetical protein
MRIPPNLLKVLQGFGAPSTPDKQSINIPFRTRSFKGLTISGDRPCTTDHILTSVSPHPSLRMHGAVCEDLVGVHLIELQIYLSG